MSPIIRRSVTIAAGGAGDRLAAASFIGVRRDGTEIAVSMRCNIPFHENGATRKQKIGAEYPLEVRMSLK
ncbi:MAG: hypothetical protein ACHQC9_07690 [Alphaproteobacteria bacterium]